MKYKCIFFDLDHTLWDYDTNAKVTLSELYDNYDLHKRGVHNFKAFFEEFNTVNLSLWDLYDRGMINSEIIRKERFRKILQSFSIQDEKLSQTLSHEYLHTCPTKGNVMPNALETVQYLHEQYDLTIITNGFEDIQSIKLNSGKLTPYFDHVITSQKAGCRKPAKEIFEYALKLNDALPDQAIMIGDNPITDIGGAQNAQIDTVFYNPQKLNHILELNYEIDNLEQLRKFL